ITGFQGADRITTGNGQDKLVYNSIVDAGDFITDFDPLNDILDLQGVLQSVGFSGSNAIDDGYVQLVSYGSRGTSLQIDTDGSDGSAIFRPYLFLQGVSATVINDNPNSLTFS
ncbi:MAG: type I secretion C-terminal target domain-containing protein, partial [Rivularia sp. (in: cyanobacteria)]